MLFCLKTPRQCLRQQSSFPYWEAIFTTIAGIPWNISDNAQLHNVLLPPLLPWKIITFFLCMHRSTSPALFAFNVLCEDR